MNHFKSKWEDESYLKCFIPNLKLKRIKEHKALGAWIPIYIGKFKKIEGRIHEHIFKKLEQTTYALKLNARHNLSDDIFRLSVIKLDFKNYDALMPIVKSTLREMIHPIIGRQ